MFPNMDFLFHLRIMFFKKIVYLFVCVCMGTMHVLEPIEVRRGHSCPVA